MQFLEALLMAGEHLFTPCDMPGPEEQGGRKGPHPKPRSPGTCQSGSQSQAHPLLSYPAKWSLQHSQGHEREQAIDFWEEGKGDIWGS